MIVGPKKVVEPELVFVGVASLIVSFSDILCHHKSVGLPDIICNKRWPQKDVHVVLVCFFGSILRKCILCGLAIGLVSFDKYVWKCRLIWRVWPPLGFQSNSSVRLDLVSFTMGRLQDWQR